MIKRKGQITIVFYHTLFVHAGDLHFSLSHCSSVQLYQLMSLFKIATSVSFCGKGVELSGRQRYAPCVHSR